MHGMSATDYVADPTDAYTDLTHDLTPVETTEEYSVNGTSAYIYFIMPADKLITKILDGNGFDVTSSFAMTVVEITAPTWTSDMNVYKTTSLTSVDPAQTYILTTSDI
jgi:hypothetical protein